jgi:plastocyanin
MKIKRRTWILAIVATATVGFTLLAGARRIDATRVGKEVPNGVEIKIDNFSFTPMTVTVAVGTTVTWTNDDDVPHTVVSDDTKTFKSHALDTGDHFSYTFTKPGKYSYFCSVHPRMTAEVVVQ